MEGLQGLHFSVPLQSNDIKDLLDFHPPRNIFGFVLLVEECNVYVVIFQDHLVAKTPCVIGSVIAVNKQDQMCHVVCTGN